MPATIKSTQSHLVAAAFFVPPLNKEHKKSDTLIYWSICVIYQPHHTYYCRISYGARCEGINSKRHNIALKCYLLIFRPFFLCGKLMNRVIPLAYDSFSFIHPEVSIYTLTPYHVACELLATFSVRFLIRGWLFSANDEGFVMSEDSDEMIFFACWLSTHCESFSYFCK